MLALHSLIQDMKSVASFPRGREPNIDVDFNLSWIYTAILALLLIC